VDPIMHRSMGHEGRVPPRDRSAAARPPKGEHARRRGELRQCRHGRHPLILSLRSSGCTSADRSVRSVTAQRVRVRERERESERTRVPLAGADFVHRERRTTVGS
jgi:hypothetical protein